MVVWVREGLVLIIYHNQSITINTLAMLIASVLFTLIPISFCCLAIASTSLALPVEKLERLRQLIRKIPEGGLITLTPPGYLQYLSCEQLQLISDLCPELTADYSAAGVSELISRFELNIDLQLFVIADLLARMLAKYANSEEDSQRRAGIIKIMKQKRDEREALVAQLSAQVEQLVQQQNDQTERLQAELEAGKGARAELEERILEQSTQFQRERDRLLEEQQEKDKIIADLQVRLQQAAEENENLMEKHNSTDFIFAQRQGQIDRVKFEWWKVLLIGLLSFCLSLCVVGLYNWHVRRRKSLN